MGNCLTLLESLNCKKFLKHTVSIHPWIQGQKLFPNEAGLKSLSSNYSGRTVILDRKTDRLELHYEIGGELGRGQFGLIRKCIHKITGEELACKSIEKRKLTTPGDVEDVRREVQVLERLSGHPNIVEVKEVFEDQEYVHLVMELCHGGELFDRIVEKKAFPEEEAAQVLKTLMEVVKHCHGYGILHRDLKPENILLATREPSSPIKVADFGLARWFRPGDKFNEMAGSAYYIAPEVLRGEYDEAIDVWSAGVVLYILLSGVPPFWDETEEGIFEAIRVGNFDMSAEPWPRISSAAKELLKGMICPDVEKRLKPEQVLNSRWMLSYCDKAVEAKEVSVDDQASDLTPMLSQRSDPCSLSSSENSLDESDFETNHIHFDTTQVTNLEETSQSSFKTHLLSVDTTSLASDIHMDYSLATIASTSEDGSSPLFRESPNSANHKDQHKIRVKSMVLHDRVQRRIGWADLIDDENMRSFASYDPSRLIWSPNCDPSLDLCFLQQIQSQYQLQQQPQLVF